MSILKEIKNYKILVQQENNGNIKLIIKRPTKMSEETFKLKSAKLIKLLDEFAVHFRLHE